ncbi:MAG: hypothetical protein MHPSP_001448 [Paramarteilia canceri]
MDNKELICRFMAEVVQPGINYYPPSADDEESNIMQILFTLVPKKFGDFLTQNMALMSKSKIFFSLLYMMNEVMLSKLMQKAVGLQVFVGMSYVYGKFLISEFNENFDQLLFDNKTIKTIFETLTKKQTGDVEAAIEESYIINLCVELILKYPLGADEISLETIDNKSLIAGIWLALKNYHSYLEKLSDTNDFGLKSYNLSVHVKLKEYVNAINLLFPNFVSEDEMNLILNAISICSNLIENDIWTEFLLELINSRSIRLDSINILLKNYENNLEFLRNEPKILYSILKVNIFPLHFDNFSKKNPKIFN